MKSEEKQGRARNLGANPMGYAPRTLRAGATTSPVPPTKPLQQQLRFQHLSQSIGLPSNLGLSEKVMQSE